MKKKRPVADMTLLEPAKAEAAFEQGQIDNAFLTSALFKLYVRDCPSLLSRMHSVFVGGDRVDPQDVRAFRELGGKKFVNAYGPTEKMRWNNTDGLTIPSLAVENYSQ